ncbi:MBL fold metallo-hydrolase [Peribacillus frigoritolerans]|jgi:glyoxylase-like metal-dependent hydrolase (beta-lactamase superfamily II)|uniref:YtnP family quorum-quenching lactonase n=1 Tax=Peribacillus TaxID=2675229 RepID=UPI001EFD8B15|nr:MULTISPECIES: MBL fold metallo-hydrolase [Peribacillus]MCZ0873594.1 MBL fold metallo-hydrolase [Peribacillus sp. AS_2]MDP9739680.1 glyoxylase-like metal-dependent hydrolase (beta-lactamase superfamily II) [Bacillus sp. B2I3]ULM95932.1 MBL fold metallo-hydrolase [Peribacillus frigoritolerans]
METMQIGEIKLTWLNGGVTHLDGGAMFGVVPKPLWSKKYPVNENNQIELRTDPILVQANGLNMLIDSGIGNGKMNDKQKRNFGVTEESNLVEDLGRLGIQPNDIDYILMTHLHFDHACGLTKREGETWVPVFERAEIITTKTEWAEMKNPNIRSKSTYWSENWEAVASLVRPFEGEQEIAAGIKMIHTGGHSDGHAIIIIEDGGDRLIHMADIMPTHAHANVLWVLAYDDYPMTSIEAKEKWMKSGLENGSWYSFYHDAQYCAIKWDATGKEILAELKRKR